MSAKITVRLPGVSDGVLMLRETDGVTIVRSIRRGRGVQIEIEATREAAEFLAGLAEQACEDSWANERSEKTACGIAARRLRKALASA